MLPVNRIRIYDLVRELKQPSKIIIEDLRREGADVYDPAESVSKELAEKIRDKYLTETGAAPKRTIKVIKLDSRNKARLKNLSSAAMSPGELDLSKLNLSDKLLLEIILETPKIKSLKVLDLSNNQLLNLNKQLSYFRDLEEIYLQLNLIIELPSSINKFEKLNTLSLGYNQLSRLPNEIGQIKNLKIINISQNRFEKFPKPVLQLTNLQFLYISGNQLKELPNEIGQLSDLQALDLANNQLKELPKEIGQLTNLIWLDLSENRLCSLPEEIGKLEKLQQLFLSGNQLSIPDEILSDSYNPQRIIKYYLESLKGSQPFNEGKIILIGQGRVGKTSLREALVSKDLKCKEQPRKTEGLEVVEWDLSVEERETAKLNMWDFGGQEIYHATHQFFFKSGLYILVVDIDERVEWRTNRLEYWLKKIQTLAEKGNIKKDFKTPVIIVGNKIDANSSISDLFDIENYRAKYPNLDISNFIRVACEQGTNIPAVITEIKTQLEKIGVYDEFPTAYLEIKQKIQSIDKNYISRDEFIKIAKDDIEQKLYVLERIGAITTFADSKNQELQNLIIIKPKWITEGIYKILSANYLLDEKQGKVSIDEVKAILDDEVYPRKDAIIEMMKEYDICFAQIENKKEVLMFPGYFSVIKPPIVEFGENIFCFRYIFKILLDNIFPQFVVNLDKTIFNENLYWRTGIYIIKNEKRALIEVDLEENTISIQIKAKTTQERKEFLDDLRAKFDEIIGNQDRKEEISIPGYPHEFVDYRTLVNLKKQKEVEFPLENLGRFSIDYLLHETADNFYESTKKVDAIIGKKQNEIADLETDIADFETIKENLDKDSEKLVKIYLKASFIIFAVVALFWIGLIFMFGWDVMEKWTYIVGALSVVAAYGYFALTAQEFIPLHFYEKKLQKQKINNYALIGINLENQEKRKDKLEILKAELKELIRQN